MPRSYTFRLSSEGFQELERDLKAAGDVGEKSLDRIRQACPLTANALNQAQASVTKFAAANQNAVGGTRNLGVAVQQAGFQVGDFFVQVASGQGVLRPFIQQSSQLLGVFGVWGSVAGAAVAVAGALATTLFGLASNTDEATKAEENHTDALDRAKKITEELAKASDNRARGLEAERRYLIAKADAETEAARKAAQAIPGLQAGIQLVPELGGANSRAIGQLQDSVRSKDLNATLQRALSGEFDDSHSGLFSASRSDLEGANKDAKKAFEDQKDAAEKAAKAEEKSFKDFVENLAKTGEARDKARQSVDDQIEALHREAAAVSESDRARFISNETLKAERALRQGQLDSGEIEQRIQQVKEEAAANYDANQAAEARKKAEREADQQSKQSLKELGNIGERSFNTIADAATQVAIEGKDAFKDLGNVGKAVATELTRDFLKLAAINPIRNALFGEHNPTLDTVGGLLGSAVSNLFGSGISSTYGYSGNTGAGGNGSLTYGGPRAGGGDVMAGRAYIVGEKRPELFVPDRNGTILPDAAAAMRPQSPQVFIDARGADMGVVARLQQAFAAMNATFNQRAVGAIVDAKRRGLAPA